MTIRTSINKSLNKSMNKTFLFIASIRSFKVYGVSGKYNCTLGWEGIKLNPKRFNNKEFYISSRQLAAADFENKRPLFEEMKNLIEDLKIMYGHVSYSERIFERATKYYRLVDNRLNQLKLKTIEENV